MAQSLVKIYMHFVFDNMPMMCSNVFQYDA